MIVVQDISSLAQECDVCEESFMETFPQLSQKQLDDDYPNICSKCVRCYPLVTDDFYVVCNPMYDPEEAAKGDQAFNSAFHLFRCTPYKKKSLTKEFEVRGRFYRPADYDLQTFCISDFHKRNVHGEAWMNYQINLRSDCLPVHPVDVKQDQGTDEDPDISVQEMVDFFPGREGISQLTTQTPPVHHVPITTVSTHVNHPQNDNNGYAHNPHQSNRKLLQHVMRYGMGEDHSHSQEAKVDLGQSGFISWHRFGVVYEFQIENPNMGFRGDAAWFQKTHDNRNKLSWTCMGCIQCPDANCKAQGIRPAYAESKRLEQHGTGTQCKICKKELVLITCPSILYVKTDNRCITSHHISCAHSEHQRPPQSKLPPTVRTHLFAATSNNTGPKSALINTFMYQRFPVLLDLKKAQRFCRQEQKNYFPNGLGIEGVPFLNDLLGEVFVRGEPGIHHITCTTDEQIGWVTEQVGNNGKEVFFFADITFSPCMTHFKFVISMWDSLVFITTKVIECWVVFKHAPSNARCFEEFFTYFPSIFQKQVDSNTGEVTVKIMIGGVVVDFDLAEAKGFKIAAGRLLKRYNGVILRPIGDDKNCDEDSEQKGEPIAKEMLKGCLFHYKQSVVRMSKYISETDTQKFYKNANLMSTCECDVKYRRAVRVIMSIDTPKVQTWAKWWTRPENARKIFPSQMSNALAINPHLPSTNNAEPINADEARAAPSRKSICPAIFHSYNYVKYANTVHASVATGHTNPRTPRPTKRPVRDSQDCSAPPDTPKRLSRQAAKDQREFKNGTKRRRKNGRK